MLEAILVNTAAGLLSVAAIGLLAWLRKSYLRFVSIDTSMKAVGQAINPVLARLDKHEDRIDNHERILLGRREE